MSGYTKLFSSIVHSTVWREEKHVKVLWVTMLALANRRGLVEASFPGLADAARVSLEECRDGLDRLMAPDPYSRTKDFEGRRIEECEGGWRILNHGKYRTLLSQEERREQVRDAVRKYRAKRCGNQDVIGNQNVSEGKPPKAQAAPEAEATPTAEAGDGGGNPPNPPVSHGKALAKVPKKGRDIEQIKQHLSEILAEVAAGERKRIAAEEVRLLQVELVFAYWSNKMGHEGVLLDPRRSGRLMARLVENSGNVHELLFVVAGAKRDTKLMGQNERNRVYDGIQTLFRDREQVERLSHLGGYRPGRVHPTAEKYLGAAGNGNGSHG